MSRNKKYVNGGSINPFWITEQQQKRLKDNHVSISINLGINNDDDFLEAAFQFLKRHKDSPDDLELAIKVIKANSKNNK